MIATSPGRYSRHDAPATVVEPRIRPVAMLAAALVLLALFALPGGAAHAQGVGGAATPPPAGLFFKTDRGGQVFAAPVLSSDVVIDVSGDIARVAVRQRFRNPSKVWLEGVYVFPLPEQSAVDRLRMRIGERTVEGRILERQEAERIYAQAASEGRHASLLSSERPNVFSTSVANIGPGQEITIVIEYQDRASFRDGAYGYRFPLVVAPRYTPAADLPLVAVPPQVSDPWPTRRDIADSRRGNESAAPAPGHDLFGPVRHPDSGAANPVSLAVLLDAGVPLASIESPSHAVVVEREGAERAVVALAQGTVPADRDFVLEWRPAPGASPRVGLFAEEVNGAAHLAVSVLPPEDADRPERRSGRDLLLVLDKSGSMSGPAMAQAKQAVRLALQRLAPDDRFNLIAFDDGAWRLFPAMRPADPDTVAQAQRALQRVEANGGTEMSGALDLALSERGEDGRLRQIVFVTDGAVSNERALFAQIDRDLGDARLFTVGIGAAPNGFFMRRAAEAGRGTFTYIDDAGEVDARMGALLRKLERPALTDIALDWDVATSRPPEVYPTRIPDLYQGEPIGFTARLPGRPLDDLAGTLTITGRLDGHPWSRTVDLSAVRPSRGIAATWARAEIAELQGPTSPFADDPESARFRIVKTALAYGLVSAFTSLVAVDDTAVARPGGTDLQRGEVARNLPEGMDFGEVFGEDAMGPRGMAPVPPAMLQDAAFRSAVGRPMTGLPAGATPATRMAALGALALLAALVLAGIVLARRRA